MSVVASEVYEPAWQSLHTLRPLVAACWPNAHASHVDWAELVWYRPAAHGAQSRSVVASEVYEPAWQSLHTLRPLLLACWPNAHTSHEVLPELP